MTDTAYIDEITAIVNREIRYAYERGKVDAKKEMLALLSAGDTAKARAIHTDDSGTQPEQSHKERQRAPRGIVPSFVKRVLDNASGLTAKEIQERAETDFELMIKPASIRSELRSGRLAGKYIEDHGRWFTIQPNQDEAEETSSQEESSASNSDKGGNKDATTLDF